MSELIYDTEMRIRSLLDKMDDFLPEKYTLTEDDLKAMKIICKIPDDAGDEFDEALKAMYIWGFGRGISCANDPE